MRTTLLILLLASCATIPGAPPLSYETDAGLTYAHDAETAEHYGREATELTRRVGDLLGLEELTPFELRVLDTPLPRGNGAGTVNWYDADGLRTRYIQLGVEGRRESYRLIAHELVHWHVEHEWGLPLVIEEGLAELVSASFLPRGAELLDDRRMDALEALVRDEPILRNGRPLQIDRASWRQLSAQEKHVLYGYGFLLAEGIGIDGLRELATDEIEQRAASILGSIALPTPNTRPGP